MFRAIKFLIVILSLLIITGGYIFELPKVNIDLSNVGIWAILLTILCFINFKKNNLSSLAVGTFASQFLEPKFSKKTSIGFLVFICSLIFIGHCFKHLSFKTHGYDMSYVHQPLFNPIYNNVILKTDVSPAGTVLGDHLAFSFLVLTPLTAFIHSDILIFFIQVLLIGLSLWFLVSQGPLKKHSEIFLSVFLIILCNRGLRSGMYFDFREDVLAFVGLTAMILALLRRSFIIYLAGFALALLSKENVFAVCLFFAFPIIFSKKISFSKKERYWLAFFTIAISLLYAFIAFKYLIPFYTILKKDEHPLFARFGFVGGSVPETVWAILVTPKIWSTLINMCFQSIKIKYLIYILGPFAFFFRTKEALIWGTLAVPGILMNICHNYVNQIMLVFHYELILLPGLITAFLFGAESVLNKSTSKISPLFWGVLIALCFSGKWPGHFITSNVPELRHIQAYRELKNIKNNQITAVGIKLSAYVNHLKKFLYIEFKKSDGDNWGKFLKDNYLVNTWILDTENSLEKDFGNYLSTNGFKLSNPTLKTGPVWIMIPTSNVTFLKHPQRQVLVD